MAQHARPKVTGQIAERRAASDLAERLAQRFGELHQYRGAAARLARTRVAVEVERALDLVGRLQFETEVAQ